MPRAYRTALARFALGAAAGLPLLAAPLGVARAHPHVWVEARSVVAFDAGGRLAGIRHSWTFDQAYSAFAVMGLDGDRDGRPDPDRLAELARRHVADLAPLGHFTDARVNGVRIAFAPPAGAEYAFGDERLTLRFTLVPAGPAGPGALEVELRDPSFYVAVDLAPGADAAAVENASGACELAIRRPDKPASEVVGLLADDIADALSGKGLPAPGPAEEFRPQILVACP